MISFPVIASLIKTFVDSTNANEKNIPPILSRIITSSLILNPEEYNQSHFKDNFMRINYL